MATQFLNAKAVRQLALDIAKKTRAHPFERVGESFIARIDAAVRTAVLREVGIHPSRGKTLL
jgi:hypothetical protein